MVTSPDIDVKRISFKDVADMKRATFSTKDMKEKNIRGFDPAARYSEKKIKKN